MRGGSELICIELPSGIVLTEFPYQTSETVAFNAMLAINEVSRSSLLEADFE